MTFGQFIRIRILCRLGHHDYTTAAAEGRPATPEQIADPFWGFWDYARQYCRHCNHESRPSREMRALHPRTQGKKHAIFIGRRGEA